MTQETITEPEESCEQWVVYSLSHLGGAGSFLGVTESSDEAREIGDKWWKAFHTGEKEPPTDYAGISWAPVADFNEWKEPDDTSEYQQ